MPPDPAYKAGIVGHIPAKGDRSALMDADQKDLGDHKGRVQDRSGKKVRRRPYHLFKLPMPGTEYETST